MIYPNILYNLLFSTDISCLLTNENNDLFCCEKHMKRVFLTYPEKNPIEKAQGLGWILTQELFCHLLFPTNIFSFKEFLYHLFFPKEVSCLLTNENRNCSGR